jgi:hypothetical protein
MNGKQKWDLASGPNHQTLAVRHFLGHVKKELTIGLIGLAQQPSKLVEVASVFARTTPRNVIRRFSLRKVRQSWWFLAVVEQLIEAFKCAGKLFQGFDGRDSMAVFNAGNIATKQACAFFDVALGEFLFLAHCAEAVADNHGSLLHWQKYLATTSQ